VRPDSRVDPISVLPVKRHQASRSAPRADASPEMASRSPCPLRRSAATKSARSPVANVRPRASISMLASHRIPRQYIIVASPMTANPTAVRYETPAGHPQAPIGLAIVRLTIGAMFVWVFFENLGKGLYTSAGYAGLIT